MLAAMLHYNYLQDDPKINDFFYIQHIDFWFLLHDQRKFMKELQQRILNQYCLLFSFKLVGLVNGFNALHIIGPTFLFPYFYMQNRSIIILWCFDWKLHALTISNGCLIDNRWSRTFNSVIWAAFVIFQQSLLNFQCF